MEKTTLKARAGRAGHGFSRRIGCQTNSGFIAAEGVEVPNSEHI